MNYEERLKNHLELAKEWYNDPTTTARGKERLEAMFPELKEAEEEKIRKAIKYGLDHVFTNNTTIYEVRKEQCLAWLKKQGEQKSANKIEPKFKVGDWVVYKNDVCQIVKREEGCNKLVTIFGIKKELVNERNLSTARLWTIQDAKDGDVLSFNDGHGNDCIELIKSITNEKIEFWFCLTNGVRYMVFDGLIPYTNLVSREDATPATKEQRDLLFKKMHEAGYAWDAGKKELTKTEQNPAWSEEDEQYLLVCKNALRKYQTSDKWDAEIISHWLENKLKSPQTAWKPSDEQIRPLEYAIDYFRRKKNDTTYLESLYQDLMKLREE